jgi:hypothetical protein
MSPPGTVRMYDSDPVEGVRPLPGSDGGTVARSLDIGLATAEHPHREPGDRFAAPCRLRDNVAGGALRRASGQDFITWDTP